MTRRGGKDMKTIFEDRRLHDICARDIKTGLIDSSSYSTPRASEGSILEEDDVNHDEQHKQSNRHQSF